MPFTLLTDDLEVIGWRLEWECLGLPPNRLGMQSDVLSLVISWSWGITAPRASLDRARGWIYFIALMM
jgi:hypothetical protein